MNKLKLLGSIAYQWISLEIIHFKNKRNKIVSFDVASMGEVQFFEPVLRLYAEKNPNDCFLIIHHHDTAHEFNEYFSDLAHRFIHIDNKLIRSFVFPQIDLFITTEQYSYGLDLIYSICFFHGQPSKGLTFTKEIVNSFDALFLYGPLQKEAFNNFLIDWDDPFTKHIELFDIGYPKSDRVLNGYFNSESIIKSFNLDINKKTLLYAPAFNEGCSLREYGLEIIEMLGELGQYNVLVKLPIDCWQPTTDFYSTGGVDWFEAIRKLEKCFPNLYLFGDYQIDPLLECSDILITCISSVSFEFLALNKPVIYIDTPAYFNRVLKRSFPLLDTSTWSNRTTVNGGKEFGIVLKDIRDLPNAIIEVFSNPTKYPLQQDRLKHYLLYNRGHATEVAVHQIMTILAQRKKSNRSFVGSQFIQKNWKLIPKPLKYIFRIIMTPSSYTKVFSYRALNSFFHYFGYKLEKIGLGYLDPIPTVFESRKSNLSICEYLENKEKNVHKHGRRDRIIFEIEKNLKLNSCHIILEIGTGTGMYLEKIIQLAHPARYEIYEPHRGWVNYLKSTFKSTSGCEFIFHSSNGQDLNQTPTNSCHLVHAHGVFVYVPLLTVFSYVAEAARVLVSGGYVVFDCLTENCFTLGDVSEWLKSSMRFPVIIPENLLLGYAATKGLTLVKKFTEIYGCSQVDYFIFRR